MTGVSRFCVPRGFAEDYLTVVNVVLPSYQNALQKFELSAMADSLLIYSLGKQVDLVNDHLRITMAMTAAEQERSREFEDLYKSARKAYIRERRTRQAQVAGLISAGVAVFILTK